MLAEGWLGVAAPKSRLIRVYVAAAQACVTPWVPPGPIAAGLR